MIIDKEGLLQASGRGFLCSEGTSSSGGSHGGLGGRGVNGEYPAAAYDDVDEPAQYGKGASCGSNNQNKVRMGGLL